jgi:ABC-type transport system involved in multi-copper enzyme maturation permease subunit
MKPHRPLEDIWKTDLPEGFDPMTAKELRQSLRRGSFVVPFLAVQVLALAAMVAEFMSGHEVGASEFVGILNIQLLNSSGPFWMVAGAVCMVLMPLCGLALMGQELEEGNHELLLLTHLNRWKVVAGKFVSLWGLSLVTFISLLPYGVVRYLVGGIEWWHEAACAGTVLTGSAMVGAGAIGASAFGNIGARMGIMILFLISMIAACGVPLGLIAIKTGACGFLYHFTAIAAMICYTVLGLSLGRSRLRLAVRAYELKPSVMVIGLLVVAPFVIGLTTAVSNGYGGWIGLGLVTLTAIRLDRSSEVPAGVGIAESRS